MLEYYAAKNIVEMFNVPIETISNIPVYYWEGDRVSKT